MVYSYFVDARFISLPKRRIERLLQLPGLIKLDNSQSSANTKFLQQDYESSTPTMGYMDMATHTGEMRSVISLCSFSLYPSYLFFTSLNDELLSRIL